MDVFTVVRRSPFALPLACVAAIAMVFISEASYWRSVNTLDELGAIGTARTNIQQLTQSVLDAETGQRGFLLTGRNEYLQPYERALKKIDQSYQFLDAYYARRTGSLETVHRLRELTDAKLSELAETLRKQEEGKVEAVKALLLSDIGKEKMEAIRTMAAQLLEAETINVISGRAEVYRTLMLSRLGVTVLTAFSLLALVLYLRQSSQFEAQQEEQQRHMQAERDRLEAEMLRRTAQLTELTRHLQTAREDERSRLARDLHDELGALLTSAKLDAARIKSRLSGIAPEAQERLTHLVGTLNSGIALKRRIIEDLRPSALSNLGLVATLEILVREFAEQSGMKVHCTFEPVKLEADAELVVYRLVQEAITNITKYANARNIWVDLGTHDGRVEITVRDDGVGFDPATTSTSGHGLMGMRYRVEAEGGRLDIESAPGRGTAIRVSLPESTQPEPTLATT